MKMFYRVLKLHISARHSLILVKGNIIFPSYIIQITHNYSKIIIIFKMNVLLLQKKLTDAPIWIFISDFTVPYVYYYIKVPP